jgi:hypothetical protein
MMNFSQALAYLKDGSLVRRAGWPEGAHLRLMPEAMKPAAGILTVGSNGRAEPWCPPSYTLIAEDWEIYRPALVVKAPTAEVVR